MRDIPSSKATSANLIALIRSARLDLSTETKLQSDLQALLSAHNLSFQREATLCERDRPDFMVEGGIALECKLRGKAKKMDVFRQLARYAQSDRVTAIILVSNVTMTLPPEINGKPTYQASISTGWL